MLTNKVQDDGVQLSFRRRAGSAKHGARLSTEMLSRERRVSAGMQSSVPRLARMQQACPSMHMKRAGSSNVCGQRRPPSKRRRSAKALPVRVSIRLQAGKKDTCFQTASGPSACADWPQLRGQNSLPGRPTSPAEPAAGLCHAAPTIYLWTGLARMGILGPAPAWRFVSKCSSAR